MITDGVVASWRLVAYRGWVALFTNCEYVGNVFSSVIDEASLVTDASGFFFRPGPGLWASDASGRKYPI